MLIWQLDTLVTILQNFLDSSDSHNELVTWIFSNIRAHYHTKHIFDDFCDLKRAFSAVMISNNYDHKYF